MGIMPAILPAHNHVIVGIDQSLVDLFAEIHIFRSNLTLHAVNTKGGVMRRSNTLNQLGLVVALLGFVGLWGAEMMAKQQMRHRCS